MPQASDERTVEVIARAICEAFGGDPDADTKTLEWGDDDDPIVSIECKVWETYKLVAVKVRDALSLDFDLEPS